MSSDNGNVLEHISKGGCLRLGKPERGVVDQIEDVEAPRPEPGGKLLGKLPGGEVPRNRRSSKRIADDDVIRRFGRVAQCHASIAGTDVELCRIESEFCARDVDDAGV